MLHEIIKVDLDYVKLGFESNDHEAKLYAYCPYNSPEFCEGRKRPTIVVCPGGGYGHTSEREAEPIALKFVSAGFNAFVLRYSTDGIRFPAQLLELSWAMNYIRQNADKYNVDTNKVVTCGFSAGGHLVGSLAVYWHKDFVQNPLGITNDSNMPNGTILSYPVISVDGGHVGSFQNLVGYYEVENMKDIVSLEKNVSEKTTPCFLWHTRSDEIVPIKNSLLFLSALDQFDIPFEAHIYPHGPHGLALANDVTDSNTGSNFTQQDCTEWIDKAIAWVKRL